MRFSLLILLFCNTHLFGQKDTVYITKNNSSYNEKPVYKTDTIVFKNANARNILIGNTILPQTSNQQLTKNYGLFLEAFEVKDCEESELPKPNKISSIIKKEGQWIIKALVYTNCCQDFLADVSITEESTINLIFHNYGMYCFCSCPFEITYTFKIHEFKDLKKIQYVSINGDAETKIKLTN